MPRQLSLSTMNSWALLVLAFVLLGVPGLAFSGLTPENYGLETANLNNREKAHQGLTQEEPQDDLQITGKGLNIFCERCKKIIQKMEEMLGENPDEDSISQAASQVCGKVKFLSSICKKIVKKFFRKVADGIMAGKTPGVICEDIMLCKRHAGFI